MKKYIVIKKMNQQKNQYLIGQVAEVLGRKKSRYDEDCLKVKTCDNRIILVLDNSDYHTYIAQPEKLIQLVA